jgi:hypothetical protein
MYMKRKKSETSTPKLDYTAPEWHIPASMDALFSDIEDTLRSECLGLEENQIELALELVAHQLFSNYSVLYGPNDFNKGIH